VHPAPQQACCLVLVVHDGVGSCQGQHGTILGGQLVRAGAVLQIRQRSRGKQQNKGAS
jgi:hypothetical protein